MPSPLYSGAAVIHVGTIIAQPAMGWNYYQKLADNGAVAAKGNGGVLDAVASGQKAYGMIVDFMAFNGKDKGSPVDFVYPLEGVSMVTEPVAILKTAHNPAAARAFVDFILSDEGQKLAVSMGYIPANPAAGSPAWLPAGTKIKLMPTDIPRVVESNSSNLKRFAELFGK